MAKGSPVTTPNDVIDDGFVVIGGSQPTELDPDTQYDIITQKEAEEWYGPHGLPAKSTDDRIHREWLGKRLVLQKDCIVVELGPHRVYKEFQIEEIPQSSNLLIEVSNRPLFDRHVWIPDVDDAMFRRYRLLSGVDSLDCTNTWIDVLKLVYTAKLLKDESVLSQALNILLEKAKLVEYKTAQMFTREDVDWVYRCTKSRDPLRTVVVSLAIRAEQLVAKLRGPKELLQEVADRLEDMRYDGEPVPQMGFELPPPRTLQAPRTAVASPSIFQKQNVPQIRTVKNLSHLPVRTITKSSDVAASKPAAPSPLLSTSRIENTTRSLLPSPPPRMLPPVSSLLPQLTPQQLLVRDEVTSSDRFSTFIPFKTSITANPLPHAFKMSPSTSNTPRARASTNTSYVPPKTVQRILKQVPESVRAIVATTTNNPLQSIADSHRSEEQMPTKVAGSDSPELGLKYAKSVLRNKLGARSKGNVITANNASDKEHPSRQPSLPPTMEQLSGNRGMNFASSRRSGSDQ